MTHALILCWSLWSLARLALAKRPGDGDFRGHPANSLPCPPVPWPNARASGGMVFRYVVHLGGSGPGRTPGPPPTERQGSLLESRGVVASPLAVLHCDCVTNSVVNSSCGLPEVPPLCTRHLRLRKVGQSAGFCRRLPIDPQSPSTIIVHNHAAGSPAVHSPAHSGWRPSVARGRPAFWRDHAVRGPGRRPGETSPQGSPSGYGG